MPTNFQIYLTNFLMGLVPLEIHESNIVARK